MRAKSFVDFCLYKDLQPKSQTKSRVVYLDYPHSQPWQAEAEAEPVSVVEHDLVHLVKAIEPSTTRVLFVENATATMVKALGQSLDIDPLFFGDHFHTPPQDAYETPLHPLHSTLPPRIATSSQAHIHYYHPIAFKTTDHYVGVPHALKTCSNRPRNVQVSAGRDIAVAHGCCSFIVKAVGTSRICLFLVDPPITSVEDPGTKRSWQVQDLPCDFRGFPSPPSFSCFPQGKGKECRDRTSMLDSIIQYLRQQPPPGFHASSPIHLNPGYFLIRIVLAEWVFYTYLTFRYVKYYDYLIRNNVEASLQCEDLIGLQRWQRHSKVSEYRLVVLAEVITSHMPDGGDKGPWGLLLKDTNWFREQLHDYCQLLGQTFTVLESIINISESRRAIDQDANIKRLTYLALFFLPLSFASTLFGMNIST